MSFVKLVAKVTQAENALEANERRVGADVRQLRPSWKALWTPWRIVLAGAVGGFLVGRAEPLRNAARGGSLVRIVSLLSSVFATTTASHAADEAEHAADEAEFVADTVAPGTGGGDAAIRERTAHERLLREAAAARQASAEASDW